MDKTELILVFAAILGIMGCREGGIGADGAYDPAPVEAENFDFYSSKTIYKNLAESRSEEMSGSFEITNIWQAQTDDRNYLHIEINHTKVCNDQFDIIWDGRIAESYPPQVYFFVRLNAEDCSDLGTVATDTLSLDLYEFIGEKVLADKAIFRVSNASSNQDVNYDSSVSTGNQ